MTLEEDIINKEYALETDATGLDEIQKGLDEIEKLQTNTSEFSDEASSEENVEPEEPSESEEKDDESNKIQEIETKEKKHNKYKKLQNDKYRALAEKAAAEERVRELEQMLNESLSSGTYHYGKNVYSELDRAKEYKRKAIEEGDVDALIEADIALNKALNTIADLEKWASTNSPKESNQSFSDNIDNKVKQEMAYDWLDNHPYLQPTSRNYDVKLASQVAEFVNYLDNNLDKRNQRDIYYSPEYFDTIDNYIESLKGGAKKTSSNIDTLPPVGGVRNSYTPNVKSPAPNMQIKLTADEKKMCMNLGMKETEWIKYKLAENKGRKSA